MAGKGKAGVASGAIIGGCVLLGAVLLAIAAMVILSLISLYPPNRSAQPSGSLYRVTGAMLKTLFGDTNAALLNAYLAENPSISTACSFAARAAGRPANFAGCVMRNFRAFNANNSNTSRRRRAPEYGAYLIGTADMYFSSTCEKAADRGKYTTASDLSSCARSRLNMCNGAFGTSNTFNQWTELVSGANIVFLDTSLNRYATYNLYRIFGIPPSLASAIASTLPGGTANLTGVGSGCTFVRTVSQADIAAALISPYFASSTVPTTSNAATG